MTVVTYPPASGIGRHQGIEAEVGILAEGELTLESPLGRGGLYTILAETCLKHRLAPRVLSRSAVTRFARDA